MEVEPQYIKKGKREPRKILVEILAFCLMPNHYHLLLRQKRENGIVNFMQKLGTGYTMYFNQKYNRVGGLLQGRFKAVIVNKEEYFIHLPYYIHLNPLDLIMSKWQEGRIKNFNKAIKFLENYRWSSYLDYIGKKNFPSVTQRGFLLEFFGGEKEYRKATKKWLKEIDLEKIGEIREIILE
jgi:putative transposase